LRWDTVCELRSEVSRHHSPSGRVELSGPERVFIAVDRDRIRIASRNNFREIGKLLEHVKALSRPESPTLPEGE
jgi:hypothetical protein